MWLCTAAALTFGCDGVAWPAKNLQTAQTMNRLTSDLDAEASLISEPEPEASMPCQKRQGA